MGGKGVDGYKQHRRAYSGYRVPAESQSSEQDFANSRKECLSVLAPRADLGYLEVSFPIARSGSVKTSIVSTVCNVPEETGDHGSRTRNGGRVPSSFSSCWLLLTGTSPS